MEWKGAGPAAGHTATVFAHPREGNPVPWTPDMGTSGFIWTATCTCGRWTSGDHYHPPEKALVHMWDEHLHREVPELRLYEIAAESDDRGPLTAEVRLLRSQGVSWERIATAIGITRQSAHKRWRHIEAELVAIVKDGPAADLARLRGALAHLAAVVDVHDDVRPEIQALYGIVNAGEFLVEALARTPEDAWMAHHDLANAGEALEDAVSLTYRQAARTSREGTITVDLNRVLAEGGRIELVLEDADRAPEEGPVYFAMARAYDVNDTHIAAGEGATVSGALATLTPRSAPAAVSADDIPAPHDPPF
ncbi:hypothetical protein [Nocardiopsis sp. NPDC055824]